METFEMETFNYDDHTNDCNDDLPAELQSTSHAHWNKRSATLFVLKNKEVRHLSQFALTDLLSDVSMLMKQSFDCFSSEITSVMERNGIEFQDVDGLTEVLSNEELRNPFRGLESTYFQKKAYHSLGLVV